MHSHLVHYLGYFIDIQGNCKNGVTCLFHEQYSNPIYETDKFANTVLHVPPVVKRKKVNVIFNTIKTQLFGLFYH